MENTRDNATKSESPSSAEPLKVYSSSTFAAGSYPRSTTDEVSSQDVMIALTYGLDLVRNGAMLVASEGYPQLANRAALAILEKK
ncbi:MAG: hypothetical protein ABSF97_20900, partial [Candidatus Sulfotelmatobacter sp.]